MSEEGDKEEKTEEATQKKIVDSQNEGNVPIAKDAAIVALLVALAFYVKLLAPVIMEGEISLLTTYIDLAHDIKFEFAGDVLILFRYFAYTFAIIIGPIIGLIIVFGLTAQLSQMKTGFVLNRIIAKYSRISLTAGFKRLVSVNNLVEFLKSTVKLLGILSIVSYIFYNLIDQISLSPQLEFGKIPGLMAGFAFQVVFWILIFQSVLLAFDLVYSRYSWLKGLRMTKQEVKEEMRQIEGNPMMKGRIRSIANNRARSRMMADVAKATVIVVNPTHYSVALRYDTETDGAPCVVAKGVDHLALRIREVAIENNVPIVENKALARTLYAQVELHRSIPPDFYKAVAEILVFLNTLKQKNK